MTTSSPVPANGTKGAIVEYSYQRALRRLGDAMDSGGDPQAADLQLVVLVDMRLEMQGLRQTMEALSLQGGDGSSDGGSVPVMRRVKMWGPSAGVGAGLGAAVVYVVQELVKLLGQ